MKTLLLSGWAQPDNALDMLAPEATRFDYSDVTPDVVMNQLSQRSDAESIIAWSLGGQLALHAIAEGVLKPKHLTLIGVPLQLVTDNSIKGMDPLTFEQFRENYIKNPARTKTRFHALVAKGDAKYNEVLEQLSHHNDVENINRWLPWLEYLGGSPSSTRDGSTTPRTLIIHGSKDAIVPAAQAEKLKQHLPNAHVEIWHNVGHAPHLHNPEKLKATINQHLAETAA